MSISILYDKSVQNILFCTTLKVLLVPIKINDIYAPKFKLIFQKGTTKGKTNENLKMYKKNSCSLPNTVCNTYKSKLQTIEWDSPRGNQRKISHN